MLTNGNGGFWGHILGRKTDRERQFTKNTGESISFNSVTTFKTPNCTNFSANSVCQVRLAHTPTFALSPYLIPEVNED